jgi:hypothetical protein
MKVVFFGFTGKPRELTFDGKQMPDLQFDSASGTVTMIVPASSHGEFVIAK